LEALNHAWRLDVDGSVILKGILQKIRSMRTDWIHIAQDRSWEENSCQQGRELPGSLIHRKYDELCCILRSPGGERIVDIVPGGTELELQLTLWHTTFYNTWRTYKY